MQQLIFLKGHYNEYLTKVRFMVNRKAPSDTVLVCIHGLYGEAGDKGSKSVQLGHAMQDSVRGVAYITTSRDWSVYGVADDRAAAFAEKTFAEERADVCDVINVMCQQSRELFGVDPDRLRLQLVGNSMGGTLVSLIAADYPMVQKIALCGSGIQPSSKTEPILSTYPVKSEIAQAASRFVGDVLHMRGGNDTTVSVSSQEALVATFIRARRVKSVVIDGANHNFSSIFGKNKTKAYERYVKTLVDYLCR